MIRRVTQVTLLFFWVFSLHQIFKKKILGGIAPQSKNAILISVDAP
jgi:hypothetical protein